MKDENDSKTGDLLTASHVDHREETRRKGAAKQAAFKSRQLAAGLRRVNIWVNAQAWNLGFAAGEAGHPAIPIASEVTDKLSWFGGWVEGNQKWEKFLQQKI